MWVDVGSQVVFEVVCNQTTSSQQTTLAVGEKKTKKIVSQSRVFLSGMPPQTSTKTTFFNDY